jgi:hypothetical protein
MVVPYSSGKLENFYNIVLVPSTVSRMQAYVTLSSSVSTLKKTHKTHRYSAYSEKRIKYTNLIYGEITSCWNFKEAENGLKAGL